MLGLKRRKYRSINWSRSRELLWSVLQNGKEMEEWSFEIDLSK